MGMLRQRSHKLIRLMTIAMLVITLVNCRPAAAPPTKVQPTAGPMIVPVEVTPVQTAMPVATAGLRVTATMGPTCPGPVKSGEEKNCTKPYGGEFVVTSQDGKEVARFTTDKDGRATIDLPPGDYHLTPKTDPKMPYPRGGAIDVSVSKGAYTEVAFELDTGLR